MRGEGEEKKALAMTSQFLSNHRHITTQITAQSQSTTPTPNPPPEELQLELLKQHHNPTKPVLNPEELELELEHVMRLHAEDCSRLAEVSQALEAQKQALAQARVETVQVRGLLSYHLEITTVLFGAGNRGS